MLTNSDLSFLTSTLTFWDKLNTDDQSRILESTSPIVYHEGDNIHSGENDCIGVILVKRGVLRTYLLSENGKEVTLYRLYAGECCILSASCLLKNITFDVHIDAECESEILLIRSSVFSELSQTNIYVENFSYKVAVDRFSDVMWAMEQILFMSFDRRLAIFLLDEMAKTNSDTIHLTQEQIAKYVGSAREVVSRMLKYFAQEGMVSISRGGVKVLNKTALRMLC
ncbi:MAG: Crp/Fnr family transcriptional regulator [Evtepia sp.]